jgi:hypothetical protein
MGASCVSYAVTLLLHKPLHCHSKHFDSTVIQSDPLHQPTCKVSSRNSPALTRISSRMCTCSLRSVFFRMGSTRLLGLQFRRVWRMLMFFWGSRYVFMETYSILVYVHFHLLVYLLVCHALPFYCITDS